MAKQPFIYKNDSKFAIKKKNHCNLQNVQNSRANTIENISA